MKKINDEMQYKDVFDTINDNFDEANPDSTNFVNAWKMADGTFTKVYPNENILTGVTRTRSPRVQPYQAANISYTDEQSVPEWGATDAVKHVVAGNTGANDTVIGLISEGGQTGSLDNTWGHSIYVKNVGSTEVRFSNNMKKSITILPGESKRIEMIEKPSSPTTSIQFIVFRKRKSDTLEFIVWHAKIEVNAEPFTEPTIWTPSPIDDPINAYPKYKGQRLAPSDDPDDYDWSYTDEYADYLREKQVTAHVTELEKKADKTALAQTNASMTTNLATKVDKGGNEQVTMAMLAQPVKEAMAGGSVAVVGDGAVNTTNLVDNAVTQNKVTDMTFSLPAFEFNNNALPNMDTTAKTMSIPAGRFRLGKKSTLIAAHEVDLSATTWGSLFFNTLLNTFSYTAPTSSSIDESNNICVGGIQYAYVNNPIISLPFDFSYNGGVMPKAPVGGMVTFALTGQKMQFDFDNLTVTVPTLRLVTKNRSKFYTNGASPQTLAFANTSNLQMLTYDYDSDHLAITTVGTRPAVNGVVLAVFDVTAKMISSTLPYTVNGSIPEISLQDQTSIIYCLGDVNQIISGTTVTLIFDSESLYVNSPWFYGFATLENQEIEIKNNQTLVFNFVDKKLEVPTSRYDRGKCFLVAFNHNGILKYQNIKIVEKEKDTEYTTYFPSEEMRFDFNIDQDAVVVENEIWICGSGSEEISGTIHRLNKDSFEKIGTISHNLGHMGNVDYRNGYLLETRGIAVDGTNEIIPKLIFYKNPYGKDALMLTDSDCFSIDFKDGTKILEQSTLALGGVFGENNRIIYMVGANCIYKLLLGVGAQDLSDQTTDKSDMNSWGTFLTGKLADEFNGTARILERFYGTQAGIMQGISYRNGNIYYMSGFDDITCKVLEFTNGTYRIKQKYTYVWMDENGAAKQIEPEAVFFIGREMYLGGRTVGDSFLVHTEI